MKTITDRFSSELTPLEGLRLISRYPIGDSRGLLERVFCSTNLAGWDGRPVAQINRTLTEVAGTLRGLHFQRPPAAEAKYVTCLSGAVFDVAVDVREGSLTFGKFFGVELSADAHNGLIIPEGFAHGFQTLTDNVEMLYLHSQAFSPEFESGINALDPQLNINWPLTVALQSQRDITLPELAKTKGISK